jgi:protein TilB
VGACSHVRFWNEPTAYTPESRTEVHQYMAEKRKKERAKSPEGLQHHKRKVGLERDGKMLNVNEARYDFQLRDDDENNQFILEVAIPRYMDTSLVECDVQPKYVRLKIKGKVLQLVLDEEVSSDRSCAQRSQTSGHLVLTLPKVYCHSFSPYSCSLYIIMHTNSKSWVPQ